jgi:DNA phosphorothioation-dependent restriction protein DptH
MLRDAVASQRGPLEGCALLIIHNSLLDTLINTAENLAAPGAVWSPTAVRHQLEASIQRQPQPSVVMLCLLDYQARLLQEDGGSMFGFEALYQAMAAGSEPDLRALGLFQDRAIAEMTHAQQIQRPP